jgi:hypothetical protein
MKKAILIGVALLLLSIIPSSFTASEVSAQDVPPQPAPARSCVYGTSGYYTSGAILKVELGATESILLRCSWNGSGTTTYSWENVRQGTNSGEVRITTHSSLTPAPNE